MADVMKLTILPDGTIKTETDPISAENHQSAEQFLAGVTQLTGGDVTRQRKSGHAHHHHTHTHEHTHKH